MVLFLKNLMLGQDYEIINGQIQMSLANYLFNKSPQLYLEILIWTEGIHRSLPEDR